MSNKSLLKVIIDQDRDTIIRIYEDRHREDSPYMEVPLTNRQAVKLIKDLSDTLFSKVSAGGRL
jgi:hypothetical protein